MPTVLRCGHSDIFILPQNLIIDALVIDNHAKIFSTDTLLTLSNESFFLVCGGSGESGALEFECLRSTLESSRALWTF